MFENILQMVAFLPDPIILFSRVAAWEFPVEGKELEELSGSTVPATPRFISAANDWASSTQSSTTCGPLLWLERWYLLETEGRDRFM
jgi:hypothetical protein